MAEPLQPRSRVIYWSRRALPLAALLVLASVFLMVERNGGLSPAVTLIDGGEGVVVVDIVFNGTSAAGTPYRVAAEQAYRARATQNITRITGLEAVRNDPAGPTRLRAAQGVYDTLAQTLVASGTIVLEDAQGRVGTFLALRAALNEDRYETRQPFSMRAPEGQITGDEMQLDAATGVYRFKNARLRLTQTDKPAAPAPAKPQLTGGFQVDTGAPIEVSAGRMVLRDSANKAVLSGAARVVQGPTQISGDEIDVLFSPAPARRATRLIARGNVRVVSDNGRSAAGQFAEYWLDDAQLVMRGDVSMTAADNNQAQTLAGENLLLDMATGQTRLGGTKSGAKSGAKSGRSGRARITLQP